MMVRNIPAHFVAALLTGSVVLAGCGPAEPPGDEPVTLRWATSAVGSAGHRAKVNLMNVLERELPDYRIEVMPTASAQASMRGYALGNYDGFYGADIAFHELSTDSGRFRGFTGHVRHEPVQSFWAYTLEVGIAVRAADHGRYQGWRDLDGSPLFTGPAAWDVRAQLERALGILGIAHRYRELDLTLAGSALNEGGIDGFVAYTAGMSAPAAWVTEAQLAADIALLNPSHDEVETLHAAGMETVTVDAGVFRHASGDHDPMLLPFFYGFHTGLDVGADDLYRMLTVIESHATTLAGVDAVFAQLAEDMPGLQRRGVAASVEAARVHPGLARYMRERGVWDPAWDDRVATGR